MGRIRGRGITVTLYVKTLDGGEDAFGRPTYTETTVEVDNVLVGQPTSQEMLDTLNLTGKKVVYTLGIPKDDANTWTDAKVEFFGETWRTVGAPVMGIEDLVPLDWNAKIMVERYA